MTPRRLTIAWFRGVGGPPRLPEPRGSGREATANGSKEGRPGGAASPRDRRPSLSHGRLALLVFGATFGLRLLLSRRELYDTNFMTLEMAASILRGGQLGRDLFDPGMPLQIALSVLGQMLLGYRVLSEFLIDAAFLAASSAIVFHLAHQAGRSTRIGLLAAALATAALPDFYHYPKVLVYPLAIWLAWRYLDRPSAGRAAALAFGVAVAFLFRHDHGIYVGIGALVTLCLAHLGERPGTLIRRLGVSLLAGAITLGPFLGYVQLTEGLIPYVDDRLALVRGVALAYDLPTPALALSLPAPTLAVRWSAPHLEFATRPVEIGIRWRPGMTANDRLALERRYRLEPLGIGDERGDQRRYVLTDTSLPTLQALARERRIADFDNFDRSDARPRESHELPWWQSLHLVPGHLEIAFDPGLTIFGRGNASAWLYYLVFGVAALTLVALTLNRLRRRASDDASSRECAKLIGAVVLLALAARGLLRESGYVVTLVGPAAVLGAWLLRWACESPPVAAPTGGSGGRARYRWLTGSLRALAIGIVAITAVSAVAYADPGRLARDTSLGDGPAAALMSLESLFAELTSSPPINAFAAINGMSAADQERALYLYHCTRPDDRLVRIGGTAHHILYYVERGIAGGHVWHGFFRRTRERQQFMLELLERQSVPFVLLTGDIRPGEGLSRATAAFERMRRRGSPLDRYLVRHYIPVEGLEAPTLVDARRAPSSRYGAQGLPCFA